MKAPEKSHLTSRFRIIAVVLGELLREQAYTSYADLKEDLKCQCAQLRVPYDATLITAALDQVERGGRHIVLRQDRR